MGTNQQVTVQAVPWSDDAALVLSCVGDPAKLQAITKAGGVLFRVDREDCRVGYYLLKVDQFEHGAEGVLVAAAGHDGQDLTEHLLPHIERQFTGCASIRIHTSRPGLAKKLATRAGYRAGEIVLRKAL